MPDDLDETFIRLGRHEVLLTKFGKATVRETDWELSRSACRISWGSLWGREGSGTAIDMPGPWIFLPGSCRYSPRHGRRGGKYIRSRAGTLQIGT